MTSRAGGSGARLRRGRLVVAKRLVERRRQVERRAQEGAERLRPDPVGPQLAREDHHLAVRCTVALGGEAGALTNLVQAQEQSEVARVDRRVPPERHDLLADDHALVRPAHEQREAAGVVDDVPVAVGVERAGDAQVSEQSVDAAADAVASREIGCRAWRNQIVALEAVHHRAVHRFGPYWRARIAAIAGVFRTTAITATPRRRTSAEKRGLRRHPRQGATELLPIATSTPHNNLPEHSHASRSFARHVRTLHLTVIVALVAA